MSDLTRILSAIEHGDAAAAGELLPLVYEELRKLAAQRLAQEKPGQTLQPTALVHEAYLRLVGNDGADQERRWDSRGHFFAAAAEAMRRILIDQARTKRSEKRGGARQRLNIDAIDLATTATPDQLLSLNETLAKLACIDPAAARLVELRYFSVTLGKKGRIDDSIAASREAIRLRPNDANAHYILGVGLGKKGLPDEAIVAYRTAIRLGRHEPGVHNNFGNALGRTGHLDEAIAEFKEAIHLKPDYALAHSSWAWHLANCADPKRRDPKQAVALAKRAVELAPSNGDCLVTLGVAHYRAGNWKEARAILQESTPVERDDICINWFVLAMTDWQLGKRKDARMWYDKAVEWMERNKPTDEELGRFRGEASELLELKEKKSDGS